MFKKANVVMLATNEKATNCGQLALTATLKTLFIAQETGYFACKPQHLYITSDEKIKEGDYVYDRVYNRVIKVIGFGKESKAFIRLDINDDNPNWSNISNLCKVIASTNPSLNLPQPSPQFIQKYIEEYNKGNIITDVMVEYEVILGNKDDNIGNLITVEIPKVNFKDNTITIKKVKDSWTKEEVIELIKEYHASFASYPTMNLDLRDNWISKKL